MKSEVKYIDCESTKAVYEHTYLNDNRSGFKKTELELLSEKLRKQTEVGLVFRPVCSHVKVDQGFILGC